MPATDTQSESKTTPLLPDGVSSDTTQEDSPKTELAIYDDISIEINISPDNKGIITVRRKSNREILWSVTKNQLIAHSSVSKTKLALLCQRDPLIDIFDLATGKKVSTHTLPNQNSSLKDRVHLTDDDFLYATVKDILVGKKISLPSDQWDFSIERPSGTFKPNGNQIQFSSHFTCKYWLCIDQMGASSTIVRSRKELKRI